MMRKRFNPATVVVVALIALVAIASVAVADRFNPEPAASPATVCFPAGKWGPAPDSQRPCVTIARLYEDGSARIVQWNVSGTVRVICNLQNPSEVIPAGLYKVACLRVK